MRCNIHKRKIYIKPRPKKDIPKGLIIKLNKPRADGKEMFISTDIEAGVKEYDLPELPEGVFIEFVFVKDEKKINGGKNKN